MFKKILMLLITLIVLINITVAVVLGGKAECTAISGDEEWDCRIAGTEVNCWAHQTLAHCNTGSPEK